MHGIMGLIQVIRQPGVGSDRRLRTSLPTRTISGKVTGIRMEAEVLTTFSGGRGPMLL